MGKEAKLFVRRLLQGMLVGSGAILPGVSGGVLCVTFGLYKPLMALLAHPFKNLPRYFKMLLPVGIGIVLGFWGLSGLISHLFSAAEGLAAALFAGLILGTLPGLYREAGEQGRTAKSRNAMFVTFALMLAFFLVLESSVSVTLEANLGWMAFAGLLFMARLDSGQPAEAVNSEKQRRIAQAAALYMQEEGLEDSRIRFDIIEILPGEIRHIEGAFDATDLF